MANPQNLKPWPKGKSGNPKGRPPKGRAFEDLTKLIDETPGALRAISRMWLKHILSGNFQFFREYLDRSDGKSVPMEGEAESADVEDFGILVRVPTVKQAERKNKPRKKRTKGAAGDGSRSG